MHFGTNADNSDLQPSMIPESFLGPHTSGTSMKLTATEQVRYQNLCQPGLNCWRWSGIGNPYFLTVPTTCWKLAGLRARMHF